MTPTPTTLANTARTAARLYTKLETAKYNRPPAEQLARKMKPNFRSTTPGNEWAISLEEELMGEKGRRTIPCGLRTIAIDALHHAGQHPTPTATPTTLCTAITHHASAITNHSPVAQDLCDLLQQQVDYLAKQFQDQEPTTTPHIETRLTARTICATLKGQGHDITREDLRNWRRRGHITALQRTDGEWLYYRTEVLKYLGEKQG